MTGPAKRDRPVTCLRAFAAFALALGVWQAPAPAFDTSAREAFLVDFETGSVLLERNPDQPMPPASMSKLMTLYMVFEQLRAGTLSLDDTMRVSEKAWRMGGSRMFVEVDTDVRVEDLLRGIIVSSGNDACIVVAEALAGSEEAFAEQMNERAGEIGLKGSAFTNSPGWPDSGHYMSARDLSVLTARIIVDFPEYFPYFAEKSFTYNEIEQDNRNLLLYKDLGADGMKTGHTEDSGYGLTATAKRDSRRLILVLNGLESVRVRAAEAERILNWGFRETKNYALFKAGEEVVRADVWLGTEAKVPLVIDRDLVVTLARKSRKGLSVKVVLESPVPAPIAAGERIATLVVSAPEMTPITVSLAAGESVELLGVFGRLWSALYYIVFGPPSS